ncbi:MAG: bifunctional diguanylate cyclase/phosphodiesterase, partial [Gammaproteobacteria bacterium]|nr:bifunctional diguanylate cyclase/phosphodiesterase [Gammaproteobacteria bacterium]
MPTTKDELTGLLDRKAFLKLLSGQVEDSNTYKSKLALLIVDINRFFRINNIFGYPAGDEILKKVALLLDNVIRDQDFVARIGDNRFALILDGVMNVGHAELAAHKILRLLQAPFVLGEQKIHVDVTIGISLCPLHASNPMFLLKECESVLHGAKEKNQKIGVSQTLEDEILSEHWDIELALDDALNNDEFLIYYQPKIALDSGGVVGVEALLRWNHSSRGFIPPNFFIPIAERMGHIKPITNWVFNTALRQGAEWTEKWGPLSISVNIPPDFILMPDLKGILSNALSLWGSDNILLTLEIVERSLVIEPEKSMAIMNELRDMDISISIDDFGTGYSSLSYFEKLPVDELKIDQSFVANVVESKSSQDLVRLIVELAHAFDMEVVA